MTTTFEFVCETFVITYKGKICSDSNKYIVSYGWHWNQWIWRSCSRCECVDQLCQLGGLASCALAHLVVQYTLNLFFKINFISFKLSNIFYLFCSPGCSNTFCLGTFTNRIHFGLTITTQHNTKFEMYFILALSCFTILFGLTIITSMQ